MSLLNNSNAISTGGDYNLENSLRFRKSASAYLSRTPTVAGNRRTWTWSGWVKRGNLNQSHNLFSVRTSAATRTVFRIVNDEIDLMDGDTNFRLTTTAVFRDPSAWYHIVLVCDTTQATSTDRIKLYVNGEQVTAFSPATYPSLNFQTNINNTLLHAIGVEGSTTNDYFDGYLTEVNFVDGQALTASDFGEYNEDTGVWQPIEYEGTYGTNGFYLDFKDSGSLGNDASGEANNWTPNNLAATDQMLDSPTNNFYTNNPLNTGGTATLSEGNLHVNLGGDAGVKGTMLLPKSGKWYWEGLAESVGTAAAIGLCSPESNLATGLLQTAGRFCFRSYGSTLSIAGDGSYYSYGDSWTNGDVVGVAYDADNGALYFSKNGVWQGSGDPESGASKTNAAFTTTLASYPDLTPHLQRVGTPFIMHSNFGQDSSFAGNKTSQGNADANGIGDFFYAPPTGYLALCTQNLPDSSIVDGSEHFNTVLYTGNGSTNAITGVGFSPDFVWGKNRGAVASNNLLDSVRGATKRLFSNSTEAEITTATSLTSFDSDGFTLGSDTGLNTNTNTYVAWNWKAGGTAVSNTDGTITSQVSANPTAGFSVVTYTGTGANATVGHGLGVAPNVMIIKNRTSANSWPVYHSSLGNTQLIVLDLTNAASTSSVYWNNTSPTTSVFTIGTAGSLNTNTSNYVAYCFAEVEGYSKIGSYTGNGSTDGTFVYTGFRPAFVLIKTTSAAFDWIILDAERNASNLTNLVLYADLSAAEQNGTTYASADFLSNGFKLRNAHQYDNFSGYNYIYMAFASNPFKNSLAR